jgi:hypothetical protein
MAWGRTPPLEFQLPTADMLADTEVDQRTGRRFKLRNKRNTFAQAMEAWGIPPLQAVPADWCRGPLFPTATLPATAALTSIVTDGAFYGDPMLRSVFSPASGGTNVSQSIGLVVYGVLLEIVSDVNAQATSVLDDILAADPTLEWTIGGVTRARSLVDAIRMQMETANVLDSDLATATAYGRRFAAKPLFLPTMYIIPKAGDSMGIRTSASLTATVNTRVKLFGAAIPADQLSDLVGSARQSQGGACNASSTFGVDLGDALPPNAVDIIEAANIRAATFLAGQ